MSGGWWNSIPINGRWQAAGSIKSVRDCHIAINELDWKRPQLHPNRFSVEIRWFFEWDIATCVGFSRHFPPIFLMQWAEKFQSGRLMKWTFVETIGHSIEINFHWHRLAFACRYAADFHSINGQIQSDDINSSCCCCCCCCWSYSDGNDSIILIRDCNSIEWESFHLSGSVHWQKWQFIYRCVRIR